MRNIDVVIGLIFGDEGKGRTVNALALEAYKGSTVVIRFSGGQQAGHGVKDGEDYHIFSNFGSGSFQGLPTYWTKYCTVDPLGLINELYVLLDKGVKPMLYISPDAPVTLPFDKVMGMDNLEHGTCGTGVGNTWEREEKFFSLTAGDLLNKDVVEAKIKLFQRYYYKNGRTVEHNNKITAFLNAVQTMLDSPYIEIRDNIHKEYHNLIFESSQGLLLDQHYGFFPHVTRSNVGMTNVLEILEGDDTDVNLYLVTRAYQTRHGNGPMTNEHIEYDIKENPEETNVTNKYQGEFRRTMLDLDLLKHALNKDPYIRNAENRVLVITCLDHVRGNWAYTKSGIIHRPETETEFVKGITDFLETEFVLTFDSP